MANEEEVKNQEKLNELIREATADLERLNTLSEAQNLSIEERYKSQKEILDIENKKLQLELKHSLLYKEKSKYNKDELLNAIEKNKQKKKQLGDLEQEQQLLKQNLEKNLGIKEEVNSIALKLQEANKIRDGQIEKEDAILIKQKMQNQAISNMIDGVSSLAGLILDKALEFEKSTRELMRAGTFTFEESKSGLMSVTQQAAIAGVGLKEASAAMVQLKTSFTGFTNLTAAQQNKVTALTATMERMGLNVSASAKFLDTATKSLGMSTGQATGFLSSLEGFAKQSGIPITELSKNLEGATDKIALFGEKGTQVFKEMSLASKQLGIDMNTLFNITERFTTFEGAADAAGKLNAILGGDFINSVDLLTASMEDPAEAFKMLKMSMDQSGKSFDEMDMGMRRVIASSIGMTVEQAGKLFSQDINTATAAMKEQAKTQEQLAKIGANLSTITEKFQNALVALYPTIEPVINALETFGMFAIEYVIKPFIEIISFKPVLLLLQGFGMAIVALGGILAAFGAIFIPFYTMFVSYQKVMAVVRGETELFSVLKKKDALASMEQAKGQTAANIANSESIAPTTGAGNAAKMSAKGFMLMGAGILMIGAGIALVIGSIALLASQIKDLSGEQMSALLTITFGIIGAFALFGIAAVVLAEPLLAASVAVFAFGTAMMMVALPVSVISLAIMMMTNRITEMAVAMKEASVELVKLGTSEMVSNFQAIKTAFEGIASSINSIDGTKLAGLALAGMFTGGTVFAGSTPQAGREVDLNMTVTDSNTGQVTSSAAGTGGSAGNQIIQLKIDINSPIELKGQRLADFVHEETRTVLVNARSPNTRPA